MGDLYMHDLRNAKVTVHSEGEHRLLLESVFVLAGDDTAEADGWVLAYVYDAWTDKANVVVLHAQDFGAEPLATIHLPQRVPYGFHGDWVPD
jgi:carotenoid cleavage dioxygenase